MSNLIAQRLHLRCFLEGIEIPVMSAVVQMAINSPATAIINLIPTDKIRLIKKRTMVHLFFYDYTNEEISDFEDMSRYRVLFIGEIIGKSYTKTPNGRSATLQCVDLSSNWDLCYQYMITWGASGNFLTEESAIWAGGNSIFNDIVDGHAQVLSQYLERTPKTPGLQNIKGLLGGIISLLEALGGIPNHHVGVNDYFTIAELKNKTLQQIAAEEDDNTAQQLFQSKEFFQFLEHGVTSLGELCTVRDMLRMLFNYIFYEVVPNTCAYYIPGDGQKSSNDIPESERINKQINNAISILKLSQPGESFYNDSRTVLKDLTVLQKNVQVSSKQKQNISKAIVSLSLILDTSTNAKVVSTYRKQIKNAIKSLEAAIDKKIAKKPKDVKADRLNTFIFRPECYFVAPPRCSVIFPEHQTSIMYDVNDLREITRLRLQSGMQFGIDSDKLLADFAFAPSSKEIAALAKKQGSAGVRALLPWEQYSGIIPKFEYINEINYIANKKQKELQKNVTGDAVSYKQKAANFNFFKHRFAARTLSVSMKFNPFVVCGFPSLVIDTPFIIPPENIIELSASLPNSKDINDVIQSIPDYIVKNITTASTIFHAPIQYLGMVQSVVHTIDASSGGATTVNLSHARTHKITEDDFLVNFQKQKSTELNKSIQITYLNAKTLSESGNEAMLKFLVDATPQDLQKGQILTSKLVNRPSLKVNGISAPAPTYEDKTKTDENVELLTEFGKQIFVPRKYGKLKPGSKPGPKGGTIKYIQVIDGNIISIPSKLGKLGKSSTRKAYASIAIAEEIESKDAKLIPIEEILRPNWFSPLYSNLYIGDSVYNKFFGTGSLVDQIVFSSSEGLSIQGAGAERNSILSSITEDPTKISRLTQTQLFNIPSVETATDVLAYQYGEIRRLGLDANKFVNDYTYRPIATMADIFGSADLEYKKQGNKLTKVSGTPGFHSASIANFGDLLGLVDNPDLDFPRLTDKGSAKIDKTLDKRPEKKEAIESYVSDLRSEGSVVALIG